jgi:predicted pyridoxine 5'-phosphate oxidase superfamily flavin-nucleotide-binding protein
MEVVGRRGIRSFMPDQHREFFAELPFLLVGSLDAGGQPWASVLAGPPGFVSSPDPRHLEIGARPLPGDPLAETLRAGAAVGLLGIQPHTRRRNRMNGTVAAVTPQGFQVAVEQSFGNCPKYIQAREAKFVGGATGSPGPAHHADSLDLAMGRMIRAADTFYIATAYAGGDAGRLTSHGVDVSHRGGKPGFVRVDDERALTVPDFLGNFFFNTLGNLAVSPRAGLLFMDFASGDLLHLACAAEIIADSPEVRRFQGAQRLLRFHVRQALRVERALPLRWGAAELSPVLAETGSW